MIMVMHASSSIFPLISISISSKSPKFKIQAQMIMKHNSRYIPPPSVKCCPCCHGRRAALVGIALLPCHTSSHSNVANAATTVDKNLINMYHHPRPDWYEEFYALAIDQGMVSYEAQVAGYKEELFSNLAGKSKKKIVEIGVGTGSNFKFYATNAADDEDLHVVGVDPNNKMEKYARAAALAAGLPKDKFTFSQGVAEALPVEDNSVDAVIGTLVLCSVKDVDRALQEVRRVLKPGGRYLFIEHVAASDGSILRLAQSILDPIQHFVSDGCHLTRETGRQISESGFSTVALNSIFLSNTSLISPHVYGVACK